jgi:hypothetical protein
MTREQEFKKFILGAVDRSIKQAEQFEGKKLTRAEVLGGWKEHLDEAEKS